MSTTTPDAGAAGLPEPKSARLPWTATAAGIVALTALYLTIGHNAPIVPILGAALLLTHVTDARLPRYPLMPAYTIRILLFAVIYYLNLDDPPINDLLMGPPRIRNMFGQIWAAEMVIQAWLRGDDRGGRVMPVLFLSGMTFLVACNTFDITYIRWLTPLLVLLAAMTLRTYRERRGAPTHPSAERRATLLRASLIALALGIGAGAHTLVWNYRGELYAIGSRFLREDFRWREGTGMSSQPSLGRTFGLRGSAERILRLEVVSHTGRGNADIIYLRGLSFSSYGRRRWFPRTGSRLFETMSVNAMQPPEANDPNLDSTTARITRLTNNNRMLFFPLPTAAILPDETGQPVEWAPRDGGPVVVRERGQWSYQIIVARNQFHRGILAHPLTEEQRARHLEIPRELSPEVQALARRIAGKLPTSEMKAGAISGYLLENHTYSTETDPGEGDPVSNFVLQKKAAHCEFFASAAALMLRCVGVPTRYVTGYFAHEGEGENGDRVVIRQRDAHAWVEAWIDGRGWITVEATPATGRPDGDPEPVPVWQRAKDWFQDTVEAISDYLAKLTPEQLAALIISVCAGLLLAPLARAAWRRRRQRLAEAAIAFAYASASSREVAALGERFESLFARRGISFPEQRTWQEHIAHLANTAPAAEETTVSEAFLERARRFVPAYDRLRFGSGDAAAADAAALDILLREMEEESSPSTRQTA